MPFPFFLPLDVTPPPPPHFAAVPTTDVIKIDGKLDEPAWALSHVTDAFTQKFPDEGKAPSEPTRLRVIYDKEAIYVGIECVQKGVPVQGRLTRRDRRVESDAVFVILDTRRDGTSGFEFAVNPSGVQVDAIHFNDTDSSDDWDENWEAKTEVTADGWTAEIKIPLRILRFDDLPKQSFGMQVRRYTSARQETDEWAFIPRDAAGEISHYGKLDQLVGLHVTNPLELRPFVVGEVRHFDDQLDTLARGWKPAAKLGVDLKWHMNQNLTLDATFNPDFGQVEADQVVLNLSTFEVYFPEKRTFFLEGIDTFSTPLQLLYTRRIGRAPDEPVLRTGAPFSEQLYRLPDPSTIWGATKLTGELGGRWTVGELLALTGRQTVPVVMPDGSLVDREVDPWNTYKLLRLKRAFGENSHIGMMAMATNRLETTGEYPLVPGDDGKPRALCPTGDTVQVGSRCYHDAYVGSLDGRWRSPGGDYVLSGQILGTLIENGPPRTIADGTVIQSGDAAPALFARAAKEGGKHWVGEVQYDFHGRKVDYNDLGFMQRQNKHHAYVAAEYRTTEPWWFTNETHTRVEWNERDTLDLLTGNRFFDVWSFWKAKNSWGVFTLAGVATDSYDDREVGDGAALERQGLFDYELEVSSDPREAVRFDIWSQLNVRQNGYLVQTQGTIGLRPLPELDLDILPQALFTVGEPRWFDTENDFYLFGDQRASDFGVTLRGTYTFSPTLTFQAYTQLFLASVHYSNYTAFPVGGQPVVHLSDLKPSPFKPLTNPDYEEGALNVNLVLRWEYRLGSLLYVVYTHGQDNTHTPFRGEDAGLNLKLAKPRLASDVFLFKLSYWWS